MAFLIKGREFSLTFVLALLACGSDQAYNQTVISPTASDAQPDISETLTPYPIDSSPGVYAACEKHTSKPTSYSRLTERDCTDTNGVIYLDDYWDNKLSIGCRWNTASDNNIHCLPENVQTATEYADPGCTVEIALVKADSPLYIGIESGNQTWVTIYQSGKVYDNSNGFYYNALFDGEEDCFSTSMEFSGTLTLHYVGVEVDPSIFVKE